MLHLWDISCNENCRHTCVNNIATVCTSEVAASELKVIVLIPVLQRQRWQRRRVGKLQIRKVPVEYLPITRRQVNITKQQHRATDHVATLTTQRHKSLHKMCRNGSMNMTVMTSKKCTKFQFLDSIYNNANHNAQTKKFYSELAHTMIKTCQCYDVWTVYNVLIFIMLYFCHTFTY